MMKTKVKRKETKLTEIINVTREFQNISTKNRKIAKNLEDASSVIIDT